VAEFDPDAHPPGPRADPLLAAAGKLLESALVKVSSVASKLTTESAQDMVKAMMAADEAQARRPRRGAGRHVRRPPGELAGLLLDQIAGLDGKITQLGARAAELAAAVPEALA
jgi:hypothetical protein